MRGCSVVTGLCRPGGRALKPEGKLAAGCPEWYKQLVYKPAPGTMNRK